MASCDLRWPEVTRKWRHLNGSHLKVAVEGRKLAYTVHFTSYKPVACRRRQSRDRKWRHVTSGDRTWLGSDVISPQVTWKWLYKAEARIYRAFHFLQAIARRSRQSRDRIWRSVPQVIGSDPELTSFDRKSPGSGCRRPKTRVYCAFHFLQGCSSEEEAVTWQEMTSRDLRWSEATRK